MLQIACSSCLVLSAERVHGIDLEKLFSKISMHRAARHRMTGFGLTPSDKV
jgi:hypothetical protein